MFIKTCKICGKDFESVNSRYCICSKECREIYTKTNTQKYCESHKVEMRKQRDLYRRSHSNVKCRICGEKIKRENLIGVNNSTSRHHPECKLNDLLIRFESSHKLDKFYAKRMRNMGYSYAELNAILEERKCHET